METTDLSVKSKAHQKEGSKDFIAIFVVRKYMSLCASSFEQFRISHLMAFFRSNVQPQWWDQYRACLTQDVQVAEALRQISFINLRHKEKFLS